MLVTAATIYSNISKQKVKKKIFALVIFNKIKPINSPVRIRVSVFGQFQVTEQTTGWLIEINKSSVKPSNLIVNTDQLEEGCRLL